jgi:AraC-like DNA-binding protein
MVCRFRRADAALRAAPAEIDWAGLAGECGYYDQSHLIHEFRQFAGETPQAFARLRAARDG